MGVCIIRAPLYQLVSMLTAATTSANPRSLVSDWCFHEYHTPSRPLAFSKRGPQGSKTGLVSIVRYFKCGAHWGGIWNLRVVEFETDFLYGVLCTEGVEVKSILKECGYMCDTILSSSVDTTQR